MSTALGIQPITGLRGRRRGSHAPEAGKLTVQRLRTGRLNAAATGPFCPHCVSPCDRLASDGHLRSSYNVLTRAIRPRLRPFPPIFRSTWDRPAHAGRPVCRRLVRRADAGLHGRHLRHRRHRHGEGLMADHLRHGQAAVRQAAGGELHHGRGEQRRQARSLVRPAQHPALREHAADPRGPRLPARRRHPDHPLRRPAAGLARLAAADQCGEERRAQDLGRCVCHLRILRAAGAAGVRSRARPGGGWKAILPSLRSSGEPFRLAHRGRGHVGQSDRRRRSTLALEPRGRCAACRQRRPSSRATARA